MLVRPYKRTKILFAKFITSFLILILVFLSVLVMQWIVIGIADGFGNISNQVTIYNYGTQSIEQVSLIKYAILTLAAKSPMFILLMTLAFTLSVVFTNSVLAIALPILGLMVSEIINRIVYIFKIAKFLVTTNWDSSVFLYGKMPEFEPISLPSSLIICLVYFVAMLAISLIVFKKKDIKNI